MIGIIVTPMERGQITLPKAYREKLGITPDTPLNITMEDDRIIVRSLTKVISDMKTNAIKPKYTKTEYLKILKTFKGGLWTEEDDKNREEIEKKEKFYNW